jgi:hypothetical protein
MLIAMSNKQTPRRPTIARYFPGEGPVVGPVESAQDSDSGV